MLEERNMEALCKRLSKLPMAPPKVKHTFVKVMAGGVMRGYTAYSDLDLSWSFFKRLVS